MGDNYRVLLVDDEPIILRSLKVVIPWEQLGMEVVGEARNGEEALELIEEHLPHIVLSDIRMPLMDGIELMRKTMAADSMLVFVILSGYGEFKIAQEAIRLGAFDYLLKPIDHEELLRVVGEAKRKLDADRVQQSEREYLRNSAQALSSLLHEEMMAGIIKGVKPAAERLYWMKEWEIEHPYHLISIALDDFERLSDEWGSEDRRLWLFAVQNILQEFGNEQHYLTLFTLHYGEWIMIFQNKEQLELEETGQTVIHLVKKFTRLSCSVAISSAYEGVASLKYAYQDVQRTLTKRFIQGKGKVYRSSNGDRGTESGPGPGMENFEKSLLQSMRTLDDYLFGKTIEELEQNLIKAAISKQTAAAALIELAIITKRSLTSFSLKMKHDDRTLLQKLLLCGTLQDMVTLLRDELAGWMKQMREEESEFNSRQLIAKAKEYIDGRYHHDLGIDEVSEYVGLSCSHFCVLFKQETGDTFLEYLTRLRVERACSILKYSDVKVYQIAPLVGYRDAKYFTQVFKKTMGMTPTEYRTAYE
ncbi:response regulator transcription factor [Paenibacillus sp. IITD108]|uniref:response regulator transcription factor n=1 Tax=Paenibacillus sp. IITD108 TaxID=3116649 RepID=UPI002F428682